MSCLDVIKEVNSIFDQPWWWDVVTEGKWQCAEIMTGDQLVARWPYYITKRLGQKIISMPPFTQTSGPWICETATKKVTALAKRRDILTKLIAQMPKNVNVDICCDSNNKYILPFRWQGFNYEPTFSYRLENLSNLDTIFSEFRDDARRQIRKPAKELIVCDTSSIDVLLAMQDKTFKRQNRVNPYPKDLLVKLDDACLKHNARKLLTAIDDKGNVHAAAYFVYDNNICYFLFAGADPDLRSSNAQSLLVWEGIRFASTVSKKFDFEGSNIEDIEHSLSSFCADFVVTYRVTRLSPLVSFADYIKPNIKHRLGYKI